MSIPRHKSVYSTAKVPNPPSRKKQHQMCSYCLRCLFHGRYDASCETHVEKYTAGAIVMRSSADVTISLCDDGGYQHWLFVGK